MSAVLQYQYRLPTRQNVAKVLKNFEPKEGLIYLTGQVVLERDDTDVELPFRQESNFFYVTGNVKKKHCKFFFFLKFML